jgi:hypothetical protein
MKSNNFLSLPAETFLKVVAVNRKTLQSTEKIMTYKDYVAIDRSINFYYYAYQVI